MQAVMSAETTWARLMRIVSVLSTVLLSQTVLGLTGVRR